MVDSIGVWYKQAKPFDLPLPYKRQFVLETAAKRLSSQAIEIPDVDYIRSPVYDRDWNTAYGRAFSKLNGAIHSQGRGELGITLAQSKLTYKLYKDYLSKFVYMQRIADICETLDKFAVFTRRAADAGDRRARMKYRRKAARVLGVRPATDREVRRRLDGQLLRTGISSFSAEYLAVHYGWSPLFTEIYQNLKFLSEGIDYPVGWYQESGSCHINTKFNMPSTVHYLYKGRIVVKLGCRAEVESELAYCLGVMGLANPAAIVWDAVKWSFVVDWVLDIGPRIQNQTAWLGVKFSDTYRTTYHSFEYTRTTPGMGLKGYSQTVEGFDVARETGVMFTPPAIRVKNPIGKDWGKAFAQISLLAMFGLKPNHKKQR